MAGLENKDDLLKIGKSIGNINVIYDCGSRDALDGIDLLVALNAQELHVFECNPDAIQLCKQNICAYSGDKSIYMNEMAVSDKEGEVTFNSIDPKRTATPHRDGNIGASSLFDPDASYVKEIYITNKIKVHSTSLDAYSNLNNKPPDLLWMDLQGAELAALQGGTRVLKSIKIIHLEVTFRQIYNNQALFHEVHRFLKEDFILYRLINMPFIEKVVRMYAGDLNNIIKIGHWFTNAIYINKVYRRNI